LSKFKLCSSNKLLFSYLFLDWAARKDKYSVFKLINKANWTVINILKSKQIKSFQKFQIVLACAVLVLCSFSLPRGFQITQQSHLLNECDARLQRFFLGMPLCIAICSKFCICSFWCNSKFIDSFLLEHGVTYLELYCFPIHCTVIKEAKSLRRPNICQYCICNSQRLGCNHLSKHLVFPVAYKR